MTSFKVAIFASGSGSNAENIIQDFQSYSEFTVPVVITNNPNAGVIARSEKLHIPHEILSAGDIKTPTTLLPLLQDTYEVTHIVLAGYLKLIPEHLIDAFPNRILNIHPALLPKYGGKGMYGSAVHRAVKNNGEKESGITIHIVSSQYDSGEIIFQKTVPLSSADNPKDIEEKVRQLEIKYYPQIIRKWCLQGK